MIDVTEEAKKAYRKAIILFLRERIKTDELIAEGCKKENKTLDKCDLKTMKIRQCYGINNTQITDPDFIQFKEEWLKVIRKEYKKAVAA
jgi:hypothetical protein